MDDNRKGVRKARHTVEVALALVFVAAAIDFIVGGRVISIIMGAAWLTCFVIYVKTRRLERSVDHG